MAPRRVFLRGDPSVSHQETDHACCRQRRKRDRASPPSSRIEHSRRPQSQCQPDDQAPRPDDPFELSRARQRGHDRRHEKQHPLRLQKPSSRDRRLACRPAAHLRQLHPRRADQQRHARHTRDVIVGLGDRPETENSEVAHAPPPGEPEVTRIARDGWSAVRCGAVLVLLLRKEGRIAAKRRSGSRAGPCPATPSPAAGAGDAPGSARDPVFSVISRAQTRGPRIFEQDGNRPARSPARRRSARPSRRKRRSPMQDAGRSPGKGTRVTPTSNRMTGPLVKNPRPSAAVKQQAPVKRRRFRESEHCQPGCSPDRV